MPYFAFRASVNLDKQVNIAKTHVKIILNIFSKFLKMLVLELILAATMNYFLSGAEKVEKNYDDDNSWQNEEMRISSVCEVQAFFIILEWNLVMKIDTICAG